MARRIVRETDHYIAEPAKKGVRITAKDPGVTPKSRVVSFATWEALEDYDDHTFDAAVVLELGIGTFVK